jgi:hypothetical protein
MPDETLAQKSTAQWFEVHVPIRGCSTSLKQIKNVYSELNELNMREAERIIGQIPKPQEKTDEQFATDMAQLKKRAFKLTVSIIGGEDNVTKYGEDANIFDSTDLPSPINTMFFTNENAYKNQAGGASPPNFFRLWIHFTKPPLFDPNPLLSAPTPNPSMVTIKADDLAYFRATQSIINTKLKKNLWYAAIHEKFAYDIGLWFLWAPYLLYTITIYIDKLLPSASPLASFRTAFYIYGIGLGLIAYRALHGYLKWAFPVNILAENKDTAMKHRGTSKNIPLWWDDRRSSSQRGRSFNPWPLTEAA